jgi:hypothetical protein
MEFTDLELILLSYDLLNSRIEEAEGRGKYVVATKDFTPLDVILRYTILHMLYTVAKNV